MNDPIADVPWGGLKSLFRAGCRKTMFSYLINKWVISRRFEKSEAGYIYRRRPDLPGILLTEEERLETLREFRCRYWKSWFVLLEES